MEKKNMMRACNKCLENNWTYEKVDDYINATCQNCGYEVSFEARKKRKKNANIK